MKYRLFPALAASIEAALPSATKTLAPEAAKIAVQSTLPGPAIVAVRRVIQRVPNAVKIAIREVVASHLDIRAERAAAKVADPYEVPLANRLTRLRELKKIEFDTYIARWVDENSV